MMTFYDAIKIVPRQQAEAVALQLSLNPHRNGPDEWRRLHAAVVILGPRKCPDRAMAVLLYHYSKERAKQWKETSDDE